MEVRCCDLEVDVNGEETFLVDKGVISPFCGRFRKLFGESKRTAKNLKVIFHNFPGGAEGFNLLTRFCCNDGRIEITPSNVVLLNCVAHFMEMDSDFSRVCNLREQTEKFLQEIYCWNWSELLIALKQLQDFDSTAEYSSLQNKLINHLVEKLASLSIASPYVSFSDNSGFLFSTRSSYSSKYSTLSRGNWWFEDLRFLDIVLIENVTRTMLSQNFEHSTVYKFLLYYQKSRYAAASVTEKCKIMEIIINLMSLLDRNSLSCNGLFHIYQVVSRLNLSEVYKLKLESLIGALLDQTTLDYLLVPSSIGKNYVYDVDLVLRLVKTFVLLEGRCWILPQQLKKVAVLMDNYLAEVGPDFNLECLKFAELVMVLPDYGREYHDGLYWAMNLYLQVHIELSEEEKMTFCSALNCEKLSSETLKDLAENCNFPSKTRLNAYFHRHSVLNMKSSKSLWKLCS